MSYSEKLKDQRWQKKRLELLEAAAWECQSGYCENPKDKPQLHVHHRFYKRKTDPWDYPSFTYQVLCEVCHEKEQKYMEDAHQFLARSPSSVYALSKMAPATQEYQDMFSDVVWALASGQPRLLPVVSQIIKSIDTGLFLAQYDVWRDSQKEKENAPKIS
jgi:hypothetical protein